MRVFVCTVLCVLFAVYGALPDVLLPAPDLLLCPAPGFTLTSYFDACQLVLYFLTSVDQALTYR